MSIDDGGAGAGVVGSMEAGVWMLRSDRFDVGVIVESVCPRVVSQGRPFTIHGCGFGKEDGRLWVGRHEVDVLHWADSAVNGVLRAEPVQEVEVAWESR